jgi:hypothetical protein
MSNSAALHPLPRPIFARRKHGTHAGSCQAATPQKSACPTKSQASEASAWLLAGPVRRWKSFCLSPASTYLASARARNCKIAEISSKGVRDRVAGAAGYCRWQPCDAHGDDAAGMSTRRGGFHSPLGPKHARERGVQPAQLAGDGLRCGMQNVGRNGSVSGEYERASLSGCLQPPFKRG